MEEMVSQVDPFAFLKVAGHNLWAQDLVVDSQDRLVLHTFGVGSVLGLLVVLEGPSSSLEMVAVALKRNRAKVHPYSVVVLQKGVQRAVRIDSWYRWQSSRSTHIQRCNISPLWLEQIEHKQSKHSN